MPSWVDITAITLAVIIILLSFKNGLFRSLLDLAALVFSVYLAHAFYGRVLVFFPALSGNALAYALLVFSGWFSSFSLIELVLFILLRIINVHVLAPVDKTGSVIAGVLKVLVIGGLVFRLLLFIPLSSGARAEISDSYVRQWFGPAFDWSYTQVERIAGVKEYKFTGGARGGKRNKAVKKEPLLPESNLEEIKKALPREVKLKDLDLPQLRLELEKALKK